MHDFTKTLLDGVRNYVQKSRSAYHDLIGTEETISWLLRPGEAEVAASTEEVTMGYLPRGFSLGETYTIKSNCGSFTDTVKVVDGALMLSNYPSAGPQQTAPDTIFLAVYEPNSDEETLIFLCGRDVDPASIAAYSVTLEKKYATRKLPIECIPDEVTDAAANAQAAAKSAEAAAKSAEATADSAQATADSAGTTATNAQATAASGSFPGTWAQSNIRSIGIKTVTYGDGLWVAGGDISGLWYSADGKEWTQSNVPSGNYNAVTYGNGLWVAVGYNNGMRYSADGKTWVQSNVTDGFYYAVAYGDGLWVAGGDSGLFYNKTITAYNAEITALQADVSGLSDTAMLNGDKELILSSSTAGSTKQYRITVDDSGTLTATEITADGGDA